MRKNQLTFCMESFGDQAPDGQHCSFKCYSDGNSVYKVMRDFVFLLHDRYAPEGESFQEFVNKALKCEDYTGVCGAEFRNARGDVAIYGSGVK